MKYYECELCGEVTENDSGLCNSCQKDMDEFTPEGLVNEQEEF